MIVNILIATIDSGIGRVGKVLLPPRPDIRYIISHQVTDEAYRKVPSELVRDDVLVTQIEGRGLSRNRNNGLTHADGDIAVLGDDDVFYRPENIEALKKAYAEDPQMDVACFKIATPGADPEYKDYHGQKYSLNEEEHHYISTIEITFRIEAIKSKNIFFDERFGLGSKLNSFGEEAVFIFDCIRAGLQVKYIPDYLVEHPLVSTIKSTARFDRVNNIFKGAYDTRRYGWPAIPAAFLDACKLRRELRENGRSPCAYLKERLQGAAYIYREGGRVNPLSIKTGDEANFYKTCGCRR